MEPKIIIHNSISLDGSLTGFMPDMELHYRIAGTYKPDAHLIGSETIIKGNEMFGNGIPEEESSDLIQPHRDPDLPWWIIVDSGGRLKGMLHTCRRFEYCRDIIILISESTPQDYKEYLNERDYSYITTGKEKIDIREALDFLQEKHKINIILTDTGRVLGNLLLNKKLVKEISLLIHPLIVGEKCYPMFSDVKEVTDFKLRKSEQFNNGCVWNAYYI